MKHRINNTEYCKKATCNQCNNPAVTARPKYLVRRSIVVCCCKSVHGGKKTQKNCHFVLRTSDTKLTQHSLQHFFLPDGRGRQVDVDNNCQRWWEGNAHQGLRPTQCGHLASKLLCQLQWPDQNANLLQQPPLARTTGCSPGRAAIVHTQTRASTKSSRVPCCNVHLRDNSRLLVVLSACIR